MKIKRPIFAVGCDSNENGCVHCMFADSDGGCTVSEEMDKGVLPDCADTPGNSNSLGYRVYFIPTKADSRPMLIDHYECNNADR